MLRFGPRPTSPLWTLCLALAFAVLGCAAPREAPANKEEPAKGAPAKVAAQDGGILYWTPWSPPDGLNYCKDAAAKGTEAWVPVYEGIVSLDYKPGEDYRNDPRVVPFLAERWEQPNDTTYIFYLRPGVKWHDGKEVSADDVVFSLNYMWDTKNTCTKRAYLTGMKTVEKLDDKTVRITTEQPIATFLENLAQMETVIYPKHVYDAGNLFKSVEWAIGTGPMRLKSFDRTSKIVFTAFKDYWRGKPHLEGAVGIYGTDRSARLAAFVTKEIDILSDTTKPLYQSVKAQVPDMAGEEYPTAHAFAIYMRVDRPPLNDVRVRRAIHLGINRVEMEQTLGFGEGRINPPAVAAISAWAIPKDELMKLPGYRLPKDQDIAEAKRLLAEAGYPDGLTISIQAVGVWDNPRVAEVAARQLKQIGINLKLDFIESGMYFTNQQRGDFETALNGMGADMIDASLNQYYYSKAGGNPARIADPELDRLIEKQRATLDKVERYKVLRQIQELMLDKLYSIPTVDLGFWWALHPYVHEFVNPRGTTGRLHRLSDLWFDERAPKRTLP